MKNKRVLQLTLYDVQKMFSGEIRELNDYNRYNLIYIFSGRRRGTDFVGIPFLFLPFAQSRSFSPRDDGIFVYGMIFRPTVHRPSYLESVSDKFSHGLTVQI